MKNSHSTFSTSTLRNVSIILIGRSSFIGNIYYHWARSQLDKKINMIVWYLWTTDIWRTHFIIQDPPRETEVLQFLLLLFNDKYSINNIVTVTIVSHLDWKPKNYYIVTVVTGHFVTRQSWTRLKQLTSCIKEGAGEEKDCKRNTRLKKELIGSRIHCEEAMVNEGNGRQVCSNRGP